MPLRVRGAALRILHPGRGLSAAHLPIGTWVEQLKDPWKGLPALGLLWAAVWGLLLIMAFVGLAVVSAGIETRVNPAPIARDTRTLPAEQQPGTNFSDEDHVYHVP